MSQHRQAFKKAFPYTIPVLTGYLFIGIAFGVMYAEKGYSFVWAILMSLLVYAGSGQYLAVNFFVPGISFLQVIFLTFMVMSDMCFMESLFWKNLIKWANQDGI